jgi:Sap, sulfolipid-1-addressing protein
MGQIVLLGLAAAVFPTLIACVAVIISRPEPRGLLLAFYLGGLIVSLTAGVVVLALFNDGNTVLGSTSSTPSPGTSIAAGLVSLVLSWLMSSHRGHALLDRWRSRHPRRRDKQQGPSWAELHLGRANAKVAFVVGAVIDLPGPFYLLALGDMATGGYSTAEQLALIVLFNAIMFLLVEVPLVGYLVSPEATAERVASFSTWLNSNGLRVMGWLVGAFGVGLIVQGLAAAAAG